MASAVTVPLTSLLLRLSEGQGPAILWGRDAEPHHGPALQRLLHERVLEERPSAEEWVCCSGCTCELGARLVETIGDRLVATCIMDADEDIELTPNDLKSYMIDRRRVAELVAADPVEFDESLPGLWSLGRTEGRWVFLTLQTLVAEDPALLSMLRSVARGSDITLIAPEIAPAARRRLEDAADVQVAPVSEAVTLSDDGQLHLDLAGSRPAGLFVPELSVCFRTGKVMVRGQPRSVPGQPFILLEMLVGAWERNGGVTGASIEARFSGRSAKDLARDLRDALSARPPKNSEVRRWIWGGGRPVEYKLALPRGAVCVSR